MPDRTIGFATEPQPEEDSSAKIKIITEIIGNPDIDNAELARKFDVTERWIRKIRARIGI
ncbi:MAG: hypothetical protein PHH77_05775 [Victivallaceae bacterium]|nr:hypothetical protein [Victivallaceae bacterium]